MKRIGTFGAAIVAVCGLAACGSGQGSDSSSSGDTATTSTTSTKPITLGFAIAETGFMAPYDLPARVAAQMAIDDLAAKGGGRPFKIVSDNMKSKPELSGNAATAVLSKGADIVVTSCDFDQGSPAAIVAQTAGKLAFSTCAASTSFGPSGIGPLAFTMATAAPVEGAATAEWAFNEKQLTSAYVLLDNTADFDKQSASGFKTRFTALGGTISGSDTFKQGDQSIAAQITKIKQLATKPSAIYLATYMPTEASAMKQLRAAGLDMPILGDENLDGDYWKEALPDVSDVYFSTYASIYGDDPDPVVNKLVERYTTKKGKIPDNAAFITGYAMVQAIAKAVEESGGSTDGKTLGAKLETFSAEKFVLPTTYTAEQHIAFERTLRVQQIKDGKTSFLVEANPKDVPVPKG
jgi:branched-chain amino acid transport system substrate-binding protein